MCDGPASAASAAFSASALSAFTRASTSLAFAAAAASARCVASGRCANRGLTAAGAAAAALAAAITFDGSRAVSAAVRADSNMRFCTSEAAALAALPVEPSCICSAFAACAAACATDTAAASSVAPLGPAPEFAEVFAEPPGLSSSSSELSMTSTPAAARSRWCAACVHVARGVVHVAKGEGVHVARVAAGEHDSALTLLFHNNSSSLAAMSFSAINSAHSVHNGARTFFLRPSAAMSFASSAIPRPLLNPDVRWSFGPRSIPSLRFELYAFAIATTASGGV